MLNNVSPCCFAAAPQGACTGYGSAFAGRLPFVATLLPLAAALKCRRFAPTFYPV
ncbi:MAG: hypothetical protein K6F58_04410 [Bacteroidales bacterium]|nr:hypothetical protein [Bacteroidales bacterium]